MRTKNIALMLASFLALTFCLAFASAVVNFVEVSNNVSTLEPSQSIIVTFKAQEITGTDDLTGITFNAPITFTSGSSSFISASSVSGAITTLAKSTVSPQMSLTINVPTNQITGIYYGKLTLNGTYTNQVHYDLPITITVTNPAYSFCPIGSNATDLGLSVKIKNKGQGEDDSWKPLDIIEIEVGFENNKDSNGADTYDLGDVMFELKLFKVGSTKNVAPDMIWFSEDENEFEFGDVDEGDDAEHVFNFKIDPAEIDDGSYILMVKAYPDGKESSTCIGFSEDFKEYGASVYYMDVTIDKESDKGKMVIVDTTALTLPLTASCEQEVTLAVDVWNIGDTDFEDKFKVTLYNTALGINLEQVIPNDLDAGDKQQVIFVFTIPAGLDEKTYNLGMRTYYDYDVDHDTYDKVSDEEFIFPLKLAGNCIVPNASITASLEEGGKAGEKLVIKSTISNTGKKQATYTLSVTGNSDWASSAEFSNATITLTPGQSTDVLINFNVAGDASGDKTFNIEAYSDGKLVTTQPVQVSIEGKKVFGFNLDEGNGAVAILIGLITLVAIAIIIILIVKSSRK